MRVCIVNRAVGFIPAAFFVARLLLVGGGDATRGIRLQALSSYAFHCLAQFVSRSHCAMSITRIPSMS